MERNTLITNNVVHVGGRKNLKTNTIVIFTANENYTNIYLIDGTSHIVATTLKEIETRIDKLQNFIRLNRSTIINTDFAIRSGDSFTLPNERKVVFSRRRWKKFKGSSLRR